jgi:hypothetical protein
VSALDDDFVSYVPANREDLARKKAALESHEAFEEIYGAPTPKSPVLRAVPELPAAVPRVGRQAAIPVATSTPLTPGDSPGVELRTTSFEEFAAVDEPGADALLGSAKSALIPEGGDVMFYGDGGAGKTTLVTDFACHAATGKAWLGIPIARRARVLMIENEGPRPLLRAKLRQKLARWNGPPIGGNATVFEAPWGAFTFADRKWRSKLAAQICKDHIDVLIAGPVTRLGMDEAGTLQQVRDFMYLIAEVRRESGRRLTVTLVHHENKGGAVSGAWEGAGDTLLHVEQRGPGHTHLFIQKARWSSEHHGTHLALTWTDGEGFEVEDERDLLAEVLELLSDGRWRTVDEIRKAVGAGSKAVHDVLKEHAEQFQMRTGEQARALARSPNAQLHQVASCLD